MKYIIQSIRHKDYFKGFTENEKAYSTWSYKEADVIRYTSKEEAMRVGDMITTAVEIIAVKG